MALKKMGRFALMLSLLSIVGALCWWFFPARSLQLNLDSSFDAPRLARLTSDPFDIDLRTYLTGDQPRQGQTLSAQWTWNLRSIQHRKSSAESWQDVPLPAEPKRAPVRLRYPGTGRNPSNIIITNYDQSGDWKYVVSVDIEAQTLWRRWHGSNQRTFEESLTSAELKQRSQKRAQIKGENEAAVREAKANEGKPPSGAVALMPGKRYIASVQFSEDAGKTWHNAPTDGSALGFSQFQSVGFRAVKTNPKSEWPDFPEFLPVWDCDGKKNFGEKIYLGMNNVSSSASDVHAASVRCGNRVTARYLVLPEGNLVVYVAGQSSAKSGETLTRIGAHLGANFQPPRGSKMRFSAFYANGQRADLINAPGTRDDTVAFKGSLASVKLRPSASNGMVTLGAELLDNKGRVLANSDINAAVNFVAFAR